ncbi:MAG TPA: AI-2E family transporter, partial [Ktedonobacterales bacterium]|nr:AI-2E family transporter [Ktedonobacterales bacterium]
MSEAMREEATSEQMPLHADVAEQGRVGDEPVVERVVTTRTASLWGIAWRTILLAAVAVVGLWLVVTLRGIVIQLLVAVILSAGLTPLVLWLEHRGLPRPLSILLIYLAFILALVGLLFLIVPPVVQQAEGFVTNAPALANDLSGRLQQLQQQFPFLPPLDQQFQQQLQGLGDQIGAIAAQALTVARFVVGVFSGFLTAILTLLITFYLVTDGLRIREYFVGFVRPARRLNVRAVLDRMGQRMGGWLLGQFVLSGSIGLASYIALLLLGVNGALLLAVIAALGEVVPIIGPFVSAVPVAFIQDPVKALLVIVAYIIIQQLESNILAPRIIGEAVKLHPLAVILALLVGGELMGIPGALIAVPVAAAISVLLDEWRAARSAEPGPAPSLLP